MGRVTRKQVTPAVEIVRKGAKKSRNTLAKKVLTELEQAIEQEKKNITRLKLSGKLKGNKNAVDNNATPIHNIVINVPETGKLEFKQIDLNQVIYWAELQATQDEVAGAFRTTQDTLNSALKRAVGLSYTDIQALVGGAGKLSLRRAQFRLAQTSSQMAIWLGKVWLGQKDTDNALAVNKELMEQNKAVIELLSKQQAELMSGEFLQESKESTNLSIESTS